jgi:GGDEF domain-containing protein
MYTEHDGIVSGTPLTADAARGLLLAGVGADDLHRLVRLAALALRAPVAMLGVEEPGRLRVVAHAGLPEPWAGAGALPLEATFCRHALQAGEPFIVQDAARHPLAYGVAELDNFPRAAYCGAPLLVGGTAVAVLSVSDVEPRRWTLEDALLIRDLAAGAVRDTTAQSVTSRRRSGRRRSWSGSAFQDPLTGCRTGSCSWTGWSDCCGSRSGVDYRFAVLFLDLDNFKHVNDTHGHIVGDHLLARWRGDWRAVSARRTRWRASAATNSPCCSTRCTTASVMLVVDRIRDALRQPFSAEGRDGRDGEHRHCLSASGYDCAEDLLRDADEAMYRAKAAGRDDYIIFDSDMHDRAVAAAASSRTTCARPWSDDQLAVHYQPVVELAGGVVTGLEALIRWSHPERGLLLPADFMPAGGADRHRGRNRLVGAAGGMPAAACVAARVPDAAFRLTMSVNLSAKQFVHPQLVPRSMRS